MNSLLYIRSKFVKGGRGSKNPKILRTSYPREGRRKSRSVGVAARRPLCPFAHPLHSSHLHCVVWLQTAVRVWLSNPNSFMFIGPQISKSVLITPTLHTLLTKFDVSERNTLVEVNMHAYYRGNRQDGYYLLPTSIKDIARWPRLGCKWAEGALNYVNRRLYATWRLPL